MGKKLTASAVLRCAVEAPNLSFTLVAFRAIPSALMAALCRPT